LSDIGADRTPLSHDPVAVHQLTTPIKVASSSSQGIRIAAKGPDPVEIPALPLLWVPAREGRRNSLAGLSLGLLMLSVYIVFAMLSPAIVSALAVWHHLRLQKQAQLVAVRSAKPLHQADIRHRR
jgi:hypothetical protein